MKNNKQGGIEYTSCLVIGLLCFSFLIGGMIGGIVGSGLMWWAVKPIPIAQTTSSTAHPTATPIPLPTFPSTTVSITPTATLIIEPTPSLEDVIEQTLPSVVMIINQQNRFDYFGRLIEERVVGSGFIVDEGGYIVTNAHVVEAAQRLSVVLSNGQQITATLIANEPSQDLAMLKIEATNLHVATWANSDEVRLGQSVLAIGSALGDFPNSVTMGIVSGLNRALAIDELVVYGLIQTDAAINQGNSGGPLLNLQGEVIGINTFIIRQDHEQGVAEGIGFAIPASSIQIHANTWITNHAHVESGGGEPLPAAQPVP